MDKLSLETFLKVATEESFSKAAEKLHITQPAISKRIANLESELNTQLFDRIGKKVRLTHSGQTLLRHTHFILGAILDCKTDIHNLNNNIEGILKLGVSHHIGLHRLPPYLKSYSVKYPKVQLRLSFINSEQACTLILNGSLDIALTTLSQKRIDNITQQTIWKDPLTFVVSDDHLLAQMNESNILNLKQLSEFPAILPGRDTYTGLLIDAAFKKSNININQHIETNYLETIKMMVSIGLGWAILPRTMLTKELRGLQINTDSLSRDLGFMIHQSRSISNPTRALIETLEEPMVYNTDQKSH
jgi:DNA-binding transcriptional LysR family regulator